MAPNTIQLKPRAVGAAAALLLLLVLLVHPPGGLLRLSGSGYVDTGPHGSDALRAAGGPPGARWSQRLARWVDPSTALEDPAYDELARWMLRSGAKFDAVSGHSRKFAAGGRGLFATQPISKGDEILRIPAECWLSHRSVLKASAAAHVIRDDPVVAELIKEDSTWAVIIGLMYERTNEYSPWLPYMRFMRRQESTVWWSDAELAEIHSPHVTEETHKIQKQIADVYDRLFPHLPETYPTMFDSAVHDRAAFTWATLTMWGRAFNVVGWNASTDTEYGIVPIADLLNHEGGKPSTWNMEYHDPERKSDPTMFVMEANADYAPGDELTISYGDHRPSFNFFVYSGFIPRGQEYGDFIAIEVTRPDGTVNPGLWGCVGVDGRPQLTYLERLRRVAGAGGGEVSVLDAMRALAAAVERHAASWPSDYNADVKKLGEMTTYGSLFAALAYRTRFKVIYSRLLQNLHRALEAGDAKDPKWAVTETPHRANECYKYAGKRRFNNQEYAMDKLVFQLDSIGK